MVRWIIRVLISVFHSRPNNCVRVILFHSQPAVIGRKLRILHVSPVSPLGRLRRNCAIKFMRITNDGALALAGGEKSKLLPAVDHSSSCIADQAMQILSVCLFTTSREDSC